MNKVRHVQDKPKKIMAHDDITCVGMAQKILKKINGLAMQIKLIMAM